MLWQHVRFENHLLGYFCKRNHPAEMGVPELQLPFQLRLQDAVFDGQIFDRQGARPRRAAALTSRSSSATAVSTPTRRVPSCYARAASGQVAAAPPRMVMARAVSFDHLVDHRHRRLLRARRERPNGRRAEKGDEIAASR
jgi:hypothetical protein